MAAILGAMAGKISDRRIKNLTNMFKKVYEAGSSGTADTITTALGGLGEMLGLFKVMNTFMTPFTALLDVFSGSLMKGLAPAMESLMPIFESLEGPMAALGEAFGSLLASGIDTLAPILEDVAAALGPLLEGLAAVLGWLQSTQWGGENEGWWSAFTSSGLGNLEWLFGLWGFQSGTENVPSTGLYKLHAGEEVTTEAEASLARYRQQYMFERMTRGIEKLVSYKEARY